MPWKLSHQSSVGKGKGFWNLLDLFLRACSNADGGVLVHLDSLSRVPWTKGHIKNRNFLLTVLEAGRGQSQGSGRWVVWWGPIPWFLDSCLCCIFTWWKGEGSLLQGHISHSWGLYPHDPATSHWALGFSMNFGGTHTFKPQQRGLLVLKMEPRQIYKQSTYKLPWLSIQISQGSWHQFELVFVWQNIIGERMRGVKNRTSQPQIPWFREHR